MIFLDFDGVLFNTVKEAYAVAMKAYKDVNICDINFNSNHYKIFEKYRYLVGSAWNYKYILELIDKEVASLEEEYISLKKEHYFEFEKSFFENRELYKNNFFEDWIKLNEPYSFFYLVKEYLDKSYIITTKDSKTVKYLLERENIKNIKVFGKDDFDKYKTKSSLIQHIMNKNKINQALFIDDSKNHLDGCKNIKNLDPLQAGWGYIGPNEKGLSEELIIKKIEKLIG